MTAGILSFASSASVYAPAFNGGKMQVNFGFAPGGGMYPYINLVKSAANWANASQVTVNPGLLDSNGYPTSAVGTNAFLIFNIFPLSVYSGSYTVLFDGGGTVHFGGTNNSSPSPLTDLTSGSTVTFGAGSTTANLYIRTYPVTNLAFVRTDWLVPYWNKGEIINPDLVALLKNNKMAVIRFMQWMNNNEQTEAFWTDRMPKDYVCYGGPYYNTAKYAGTTSHSGNDYSITFGSGAPTDKQQIHLYFDANATLHQNTAATLTTGNPTAVNWTAHGLSAGDPIMFNSTGVVRPIYAAAVYYVSATSLLTNSFQVVTTPGGSNLVTGTMSIVSGTYNSSSGLVTLTLAGNVGQSSGCSVTISGVTGTGADLALTDVTTTCGSSSAFTTLTYTIATAKTITSITGGTVLLNNFYSGGITTSISVSRPPTLNLNGTGAIPFSYAYGNTLNGAAQQPTTATIATCVYDADLKIWMKYGGDGQDKDQGIWASVPYELMIDICAKVGCHPWFNTPMWSSDPPTGYMASLAALVKSTGPSWMIPRFEGSNEQWNGAPGFWNNLYSTNKRFFHWDWNIAQGSPAPDPWYAMQIAVLGQDIASVYGPLDPTKAQVIIGMHTTDGTGGHNERFLGTIWIANGPTFAGYSSTAAYLNATHLCGTDYATPFDDGAQQQVTEAWNWAAAVTASDVTTQNSILDTFLNSLSTTGSGGTHTGTTPENVSYATSLAGNIYGLKLCWYEGGFNTAFSGFYPDHNLVYYQATSSPSNDANAGIITASNASQCVLTLGNDSNGTAFTAIAGMAISISGMGSTLGTFLNNVTISPTSAAWPTSGNSTITFTSHGLVDQKPIEFIQPGGGVVLLQSPFALRTIYWVNVIDANTFTLSATKGGSAIVATSTVAASGTAKGFAGYNVVSVTGNLVTIDIDTTSAGSGTYGSALASYLGSGLQIDGLRNAANYRSTLTDLMWSSGGSGLINQLMAIGNCEFPSKFTFASSSYLSFGDFQPDIYSTPLAEWPAIAAFSQS